MFSSTLNRLADRFGSDKGSQHGDRHRYAQLYDVLFHDRRESLEKMVELGLARGGPEALQGGVIERRCDSPSIAMWAEYFPAARIIGFDISDFSHLEARHQRFSFIRGDCGSAADLRRLAGHVGNDVDLIVDDASHASFHQQLALRELFPALRRGGLYIIEDLHWQPDHIEVNLPPAPKTIDWLSALRDGTGQLTSIWSRQHIETLASQVASLSILRDLQVPGGRYCNALALRKI